MRLSLIFLFTITFLFSCSTRKATGGLNDLNKLGQSPLWFIDSTETQFDTVKAIDPRDISNILVLLPKKAKKKLGDKAIDGAVYVTTVKSAKLKYWSFFSSQSNDYKQAIKDYQADSSVAYFLNGHALPDSATGTLYLVESKNLRRLKFGNIDSIQVAQSVSKYNKQFVLYIEAKRPKGLKADRNWK